MKKLTDTELAQIAEGTAPATRARYDGDPYATACEVHEMASELIELRALIATAIPCGFEEPRVVKLRHGLAPIVTWDFGDDDSIDFEPNEAIAIGAGLIRAALAAKGDKP
jgi:hypothetical protein